MSILKTVYLMTQLQNIGDFGHVVCLIVLWQVPLRIFLFSKRYRGEDDYNTIKLFLSQSHILQT